MYTADDALTFGYGPATFNRKCADSQCADSQCADSQCADSQCADSQCADSRLWFKTSRCTRPAGSFKDECIAVATLLANKARTLARTPVLLLSGGLDSEVVAKSFIDAGIAFETCTWRFTAGLNSHELYFAERFAARHGLKIAYYDIDPIAFLASPTASALARATDCQYAIMLMHMRAMDHVWARGGLPVLGGLPIAFTAVAGEWVLEQFEYVLSWYWHIQNTGMDTGLAFYQYTPEIALAFSSEARFDLAVQDQTSLRLKYNIYRSHWSDLVPRPKYTGAEQIQAACRSLEARVAATRALAYGGTFKQPRSEFIASIRST